jgi:hypothetical protein
MPVASEVPAAVAELCEDPQSHSVLWPGAELLHHDRFDLWLGPPIYPGLTCVLNVRGPEGCAAELLRDVRARMRERGRTRANWMLGSHATPVTLVDDLVALGLTRDIDPVLKGLVCSREPDGVDPSVEVRRAATREDMHAFYAIQQEAFGEDRNASDGGDAFVDQMFEAERSTDAITTYLAYLDGEPVATARATFTPVGVVLNGGSTLARARGRGIYRALVAARWRDAVARGTPFLTTLARPSSHPILVRMGFVQVCEVRVLNDVL